VAGWLHAEMCAAPGIEPGHGRPSLKSVCQSICQQDYRIQSCMNIHEFVELVGLGTNGTGLDVDSESGRFSLKYCKKGI